MILQSSGFSASLRRFRQALAVMALIWALPVQNVGAQKVVGAKTTTTTTTRIEYDDGSIATVTETNTASESGESVAKPSVKRLQRDPFTESGTMGHFTWGVDLGSGVDLTAHDMTMFELGGVFGYKGRWLRFAGVGASIMSMMGNSSRCYPLYAMIRTSFSPYHRLCFLEVKGGVSFNSILEYKSQAGFYGSLGIGLTLAHSRKFSSHVVLRGIFMPLKPVEIDGTRHLNYDLAYAAIGIGCAF